MGSFLIHSIQEEFKTEGTKKNNSGTTLRRQNLYGRNDEYPEARKMEKVKSSNTKHTL